MMNKKIGEISRKYGEHVFRMAITHLMQVGVDNLKDADVEAVCQKMMKETPENYIMTPEFRCNILKCSVDLAQIPVWDILKYIQTDIGIDGVTVHPGIIVNFRQNATCRELMTCVVPADTDDEKLEEAVNVVEKKLEAYIRKTGSAYGFSFCNEIEGALKAAKIHIKDIPVDKTFYL